MALTERLAILIEANAGKAIAEFKKVGAAATTMGNDSVTATKGLGRLGQAGAAAGGLLKTAVAGGAVAAGGALIAFGVSSVKVFNDLAQEVLKFQRASGATAEEASALIAAFDDMGIEAETGSKAIFMLGKNLVTSKDKLAEFGITAVKNKAGNTDLAATLKSVADAYVKTADQGQRNAMVAVAFGKAGRDLIPILEKGSAGIEAFYAGAEATGQILSQEDIDKAEEFRLAMDELGDAVREISIAMGKALTPFISDAATAIAKAIDLADKIVTLNGLIAEKPSGAGGAGAWLDALKNKLLGIEPPAKEAGKAIAEIPLVDAVDFTADFDKEVDALSKTLFSAAAATRALTDAQESLDDANRKLSDATAAYNKLVKEGAVDEEKVADARTSLADATRSLADANRGVAKSQEEYNDAQAAFLAMPSDTNADKLADAGENLADAQDTQASASERAKDAADDLAKAQAGDPEFQKKLADARRGVADATDGVADATFTLGRRAYENVIAHDAETEAIASKATQLERVRADLEAMLKLNPAMFPFLGPLLAGLPAAAPPPAPPPGPLGGGGLLPGLSIFPLQGGPSAPGAGSPTTNHINVNVASPTVDPVGIAKNIVWEIR